MAINISPVPATSPGAGVGQPTVTVAAGPLTLQPTPAVGEPGVGAPTVTVGAAPARPVVAAAAGPIPMLFAVDPSTRQLQPLHGWTSLKVSPQRNSVGALSVTCPVGAPCWARLDGGVGADPLRALEVRLWLGGTQEGALGGWLVQKAGDDLGPDRAWTFDGHLMEWLLGKAVIAPQPVTVDNPKAELVFAAATYGDMLITVVQQAQARGALPLLTWDFTTTHDSAGQPWDPSLRATVKFAPRTTVLALAQKGVDLGLGEFEVSAARVLRAYNPGGRGVDRTGGGTPLLFGQGRNLSGSSRRETSRDAATAVLAAGGDGLYAWATDATAQAALGWRAEVGVDAGQASTQTGVDAAAAGQMRTAGRGTAEYTGEVVFADGRLPLVDYGVGDWAVAVVGASRRRLRIAQLDLTFEAHRPAVGTVVLNDVVTDALEALYRRLDAVQAGDVVVGASAAPGAGEDTMPPAAPAGLVVSSPLAYQQPGVTGTLAQVRAGWLAVTTDADGTAADDVAGYRVQWAYLGVAQVGGLPSSNADGGPLAWEEVGTELLTDTSVTWGGVEGGRDIGVRVAAVDNSGNWSSWSARVDITTQADDVPPPVPSTPVGTVWFRTGDWSWDGLGSLGQPMPEDFWRVELHVATAAGFTPDRPADPAQSSTLRAYLYGAGTWNVPGLEYGTTYYGRLVAVDTAGNASAPSGTSAAVVAQQLVQIEIGPNAVGREQIIDLEVIRGKIADLAVNTLKVEEVSVGVLTTGTMTATVTNSGTFQTASSGNRVMFDSAGLRLYQGETVVGNWKTSDASILITGTYQSALSGERINILPDGTMRFYPAAGTNFSQINNYGNDLMIRGIRDANNRSGRVNVNALGAGMNFSAESEIPSDMRSEIVVFDRRTRMTAPFMEFSINGALASPNGDIRRASFVTTDSSKQYIAASWVSYRTDSGGNGGWSGNGAGIKFQAGQVLVCGSDDLDSWGVIKANEFLPPSSLELKQDVHPIGVALQRPAADVVRAVHPITFAYRASPGVRRLGWAVEHLAPVVPDAVDGMDGPAADRAVRLVGVAAVTWAAAGEAHDRLDELTRRVEQLEMAS